MNNDQAEQLGRIEERLIALDARSERLEARLYGNGQPGDIEAVKDRLASLELWRAGVIAIAAFITTAIGWMGLHRR